ncbi:ABC transporter substrate-binding protein [Pseudooceanicola sp. 216_PA32_1]|uniref:ABC transporter substrate-binding protein n=1 Tax=Pseudooceanicola pacificus TaxID=2676438 RepID=A0A844W3K4_9RHOB|nr:ABC transporter substrate-binding protein [Pseudooceanicola pacificus]MWB78387.1 ABC transporter substrate-binding protein [Pseudooceanicola pacificus]
MKHFDPRKTIGILLSATVLATATLAPALAEEPKMGGTIIYANNSGPGQLDPQMSASLVELEVEAHIFESLVSMDENYSAQPMLAESYEISDDGTTFTFHLRKGVKFSDGQEMTSADVKATYERYAEVSPGKGTLADVKEYRTPDPYTFVIELNKLNAVFIDQLKTPVYPLYILPASQRNAPPRGIEVIGTGPFKLGEWVKDSHLVIEKNPEYVPREDAEGPTGYVGKKTVYVDGVRYNFLPEANARVAAMQTGEADITTSLPLDLAKRLEGTEGVVPVTVFPYCQQYLIVHSSNPPTDNRLIRQAIRTAADVDDLILASGEAANKNFSMVYPNGEYFIGEDNAGWYDGGDPEKAKALLKEAGYNGEEILLQTNTNYDYMRDSIIVLAEQLKAAGMNVKLDVTDWTTNASNLQSGNGGWNVSTTSFCSNPILGPQQWETMIYNFPHIENNEKLDTAYAKFYSSLDLPDRVAAWKDIEAEVLDGAYMIKVSDRGSNRALSTDLKGFRPYNINIFWDMWLDR